jgi:hypothetical protein
MHLVGYIIKKFVTMPGHMNVNLTCSMQNMYWCNKFFIKIKWNNSESTNRFVELRICAIGNYVL